MKLFDVNILIYAHRADQPEHRFYKAYLENELSQASAFALSPLVAGAFVRIVTHPRFPNGATPLPQALATIENISQQASCHWVSPGRRHWSLLAKLCRDTQSEGKLVADAQHAAIAIEHACEWVTRDRDFERFVPYGLQLTILEP